MNTLNTSSGKIIGYSLVGIALLLGVIGFFRPATISKETIVERPIGATPGTDFGNYYSFGGVKYWAGTQAFNATSSDLCLFTAPFASSTLTRFTAQWASSTLGGIAEFTLSTSTATNITSTSSPFLAIKTLSLRNGDYMIWQGGPTATSSANTSLGSLYAGVNNANGLSNIVFSQNASSTGDRLVLKVASGTPVTITAGTPFWQGTCSATYQSL